MEIEYFLKQLASIFSATGAKNLMNSKGVESKTFFLRILALITVSYLLFPSIGSASEIKIGILAKRGEAITLKKWQPTADYLTKKIPGNTFRIVPLDFDEIFKAIDQSKIDFVICNSGMYIELEDKYGISRIASMMNRFQGRAFKYFGSAIIRKKTRPDLKELSDLKGKKFGAVERSSYGGWIMAWYEMTRQGINPKDFFEDIRFLGTHDAVVFAVRNGEVDAGSVRTDELELLESEGKIKMDEFELIGKRPKTKDFPFVVSTDLYPEWPIAKLQNTSDELASKIVVALLTMSIDSPAAIASEIGGWTVPLDYQSIRNVLKDLRIGPYKDFGRMRAIDFLLEHWKTFLIILLALLLILITAMYIMILNKKLTQTNSALLVANTGLEESKSRYRAVAQSANDAIVSCDCAGTIISWNRGAEAIFGYPESKAVGLHLTALMPQSVHNDFLVGLERVKSGGEKKIVGKTIEVEGLRFDGEIIPLELSLSEWKVDKDHFFTGIMRDISERKRADKALQIAQNIIQQDLSLAKKIQQNTLLMHSTLPSELKISPVYIPMSEVGGDFYCINKLNESTYRIFLADATGHGVQAAMITMAVKGIYDNIKLYELEVNTILEIFNNDFINRYHSLNSFLTAIIIDINIQTQKIIFASAGHPAAILLQDDSYRLLGKTGGMIGIRKNELYHSNEMMFYPNERLYLFTDGIFEQFNSLDEEFGEDRLYSSLLKNFHLNIEHSIQEVLTQLDKFLDGKRRQDDITILGVEYKNLV